MQHIPITFVDIFEISLAQSAPAMYRPCVDRLVVQLASKSVGSRLSTKKGHVMGIGSRLAGHIADKGLVTITQGMHLGDEITGNSNVFIKSVGLAAGVIAGGAVAAIRLANPLDIADSILTPEKDMIERVEKKMDALIKESKS
ncbi:hypothetical protein [Falsiroseomonas sp.]|uniref:hypothetical protein n=1 Tax=Falsiroseomonas sp. TaxID=2870721 RepID=UPI003F6ECC19